MLVIGCICIFLLLLIEYNVITRTIYWIRELFVKNFFIDGYNQTFIDSDVAAEKSYVAELKKKSDLESHSLVIRNVSKVYAGSFLAVNQMSLKVDQ